MRTPEKNDASGQSFNFYNVLFALLFLFLQLLFFRCVCQNRTVVPPAIDSVGVFAAQLSGMVG